MSSKASRKQPLSADEALARAGDVEAMFDLGCGSEYDWFTEEASAFWMTRAAISGHKDAQFNLGVSYHKGTESLFPRNYPEAARWYVNGAETISAKAVGSPSTRVEE